MRNERVAILDGAHSLFQAKEQLSNAKTAHAHDAVGLRAIPGFRQLVLDAIKDVGAGVSGKMASIDVGVVCDAPVANAIGKALFSRVLTALKAAKIHP